MENKQSPSNKKLLCIQEEKLIREVDYSYLAGTLRLPKKQLPLDLEILQKNPTHRQGSQKVLVSIKPRAPAIKTLFIREKSRFHTKKGSDKSGSHLAIGDHLSFTTHFGEPDSNIVNSIGCCTGHGCTKSQKEELEVSTVDIQVESSSFHNQCSPAKNSPRAANIYNDEARPSEKCYVYTQPQLNMNLRKLEANIGATNVSHDKVNIATLVITNTSSDDSAPTTITIKKLHKRIDHLERKILRQEMVFRSIDPNIPLSSSDEESKDNTMRTASGTSRPGCSYVHQYSHVPETSAFQRYVQQTAPLSSSRATTLEKEHNSEQYGRDFTAYDGITARGRRQCASVPCKRNDIPKLAAERVHKIRHKLNPVRDYRLMDTVHYLAQGEFAPRDDGIKLTPSREAVLSDIIWEDVCRTHWPNTRLGHRVQHPERYSTRCDLQRLIDSLLRERVAHVERRRRRHYRIVKLNHRHESCRPIGKTGDIIVASHKNKQPIEEASISDHNTTSARTSNRRWQDQSPRRSHKSYDKLTSSERRQSRPDDCAPGPSYVVNRSPVSREPTCCYQTSNPRNPETNLSSTQNTKKSEGYQELTSGSSSSACKAQTKNPRYIVKKDTCHRKYYTKDEPNLEHFILLPTLVVRTPSNMNRQKKFNELYHRILNGHSNNAQDCLVYSEAADRNLKQNPNKKDIGFNINITLSNSEEQMIKD